jgi:RDD family
VCATGNSTLGVAATATSRATTGSSIGKSILKFKVVSEKAGQPLGFGLSILRQIAHGVDAIICYVGFLFPFGMPSRRRSPTRS